MIDEEEEIVSRLENKIKNLESLYKKYRKAYLDVFKKFKKLALRKEEEKIRIKKLLKDLDLLLSNIKEGFDRLEKVDERLSAIEEEIQVIKMRLDKIEKNLFKYKEKL